MATVHTSPGSDREVRTAKPQTKIDRKALREDINARYKNTLRYLGR